MFIIRLVILKRKLLQVSRISDDSRINPEMLSNEPHTVILLVRLTTRVGDFRELFKIGSATGVGFPKVDTI